MQASAGYDFVELIDARHICSFVHVRFRPAYLDDIIPSESLHLFPIYPVFSLSLMIALRYLVRKSCSTANGTSC